MNAKVIKASALVLSVFLLIYVGFQVYALSREGYVTQTVYAQTVTQTIPVKGIFFREETVVPIETQGVVSSVYSTGTKVAVKTVLGSVYENAAAVRSQMKLNDMKATLEALKKAQNSIAAADVVKPEVLNGQAADYVNRLIAGRDSADLSGVPSLKAGLTEVMAKRWAVLDVETDYSARITALETSITELQSASASNVHSFVSTASGYYVDHVDGFEETLTKDYEDSLDAAQVDALISDYKGYEASQGSVKIVTDHHWQFVFTLSELELQSLAGNRSVELSFPNQKEAVRMTVDSSERDPETGRYKMVLEGDSVSSFLLGTRVQSGEIVVTEYSGLKIPKEALRFPKNEMGVYVQIGDKVYFRKIDKIYETADYVLSRIYYKGDTDASEYVKLYDTIVVKGKDLYDAKLLQ